MINEAVYSLYEGIAGVEEIDTIMKLGMAHPMGPLQLADVFVASMADTGAASSSAAKIFNFNSMFCMKVLATRNMHLVPFWLT